MTTCSRNVVSFTRKADREFRPNELLKSQGALPNVVSKRSLKCSPHS
jgi:hypothetical protein